MKEIVRPEVELLEVDLGDGSDWLSTRLYLLAALAHDLSDVRAIVLLSGGVDRQFVGVVTPRILRARTAAQAPELETTYLDVASPAPVAAATRVDTIVFSWRDGSFGPQKTAEKDFAIPVSPVELRALLGCRLGTDSVDWPGYAEPRLVRSLVRDFEGEYVALLRAGSLDRVVNRLALAAQVAAERI